MNNGVKILTGFSLGLLTGAVAGLLYAPEKGDKTRKKLKKNVDKSYKDSMKKIDELKSTLNQEIDNVSSKGKETLSQLKESVNYKN
ncbi:YtxH domain-containing protein [Marivirga arenosa]|uniref:YtxH domain-containing protein n=1 Tax=Marivirga arenosa TaxID=3059076 RepID=A0AA51N7F8_9BACT|nr:MULTISPECIES: YtxH domain-containing protein [unclassified Marivirga]WKK82421.1 YtxH domain-containing protein [Marivirga sp. BKB1-2]WMN07647.1 YtxH domain-containing protein [Marivirga sp. ABR2-2]